MALQPVSSWNNLSASQRLTLKNGGSVPGFISGICNGAGANIELSITSSAAPNAPDPTTINARQPRRWGNSSFYLARQGSGGGGVKYCFDLSSPAAVGLDSREHAYFAEGENLRVTANNGGVPVSLTASYAVVAGSGGINNASITGNGTGSVHLNANGRVGGGLWWSVSSGGAALTQVCVEYYDVYLASATVEPFRLLIDGTKCVADAPVTCNNSAPISRWGRLNASNGTWLDDGTPVYGFHSGFCDESGDAITFIEVDAEPSAASGNPGFLNNAPPRIYGRHSLDNSREYVGMSGNTYCFTLDEARPLRLNSAEHKLFAGPERVRLRAWLGADPVALAGVNTGGPAPVSNANGLTFSGNGYGKNVWWSASSGNSPVSKVCVEYWRVDGGALTGEPFTMELCANRCLYDDTYACSVNPAGSGSCMNGIPEIFITKNITPHNEYGLNTCTNASGNVELPQYKITLSMYNYGGGAKELFLIEDLLAYFGTAYVDTVKAPHITYSDATGPPMINPYYDGMNYTDIFLPGTGWLAAGQTITVEMIVRLNPNAAGALTSYCNTAWGGGSAGSIIVSDLSGNLQAGYGTPTTLGNLPVGITATPAQDVTLEATLMNYMNGPQAWVNNHGGATFTVPANCGPVTWSSDFDMDNWVWNCSYIDGHIDVTFTATDACGHTFTTCATFTLEDTQGPGCVKPTNFTLDCSDPNAAADLDEWLNYDGNWNDLSQPVTFTHDFTGIPPGACNGAPITVTWTATDNCGNETIFVGYLTVIDNGDPVFDNLPTTLNLTPCDDVPPPANVTASDACDPNVTVTFDETSTGPVCDQIIIRTWTATDDCGNSITGSQTIYIVDTLPPLFSNVPPDITAECPNVPPVQDPTVTDCSPFNVTFSEQQTGGACPLPNIITRTWVATDSCGNTSAVTQTITMTPPFIPSTLIFTFVPPDISVTCDQNPGFGDAVAETTCPAGGLSVSFTDVVNSTGDCSQPFSITRTWIAHDACGNMATASQTISTGPDTQVPLFANDTPDSITVDCNGPLYEPVAFDNCGATLLSYIDSGQTGNCAAGFQFTRTWTATDLCGNSSTFTQFVTTNPDTTAPVFIFVPYDQFFDCEDTIIFPDPIAFDNCGDVTITWQDSIIGTGDCHEVNGTWYGYDIIRTWTATDECGNSTTATTSAWVLPGFNSGNLIAFAYVPADQTVDCSGDVTFGNPVCHSACGSLTVSFVDEITDGNCSTPTIVTRTWTATDVCGNSVAASQTVTILPDQAAPSIAALPDPLTISCADSGMPDFATPIVTDNCASGTAITLTHADTWSNGGPAAACASQSVTRTWTATDACGNSVSASQTVTLVDDTAPTFDNTLTDHTVSCNDPVVFGTLNATDNCSTVNLNIEDENWTIPCGQVFTRTWTATDACGNSVVATQKITQEDTDAPVFSTLPDDLAIECGQPIEFGYVAVADACSTVALTSTDEVLPLACGEQHVRTWTAADACGNSTIAKQTITVTDNQAPVFTTDFEDLVAECGQPLNFADMAATDGCSSVALTFTDAVLPGACEDTHTRTWTATDACGNSVSASQNITVTDTQVPVFGQMPTDLTMTQDEFNNWTPPVPVVDDCHPVTLTTSTLSGTSCEVASHLFTWTAADGCGNTAQQTLLVTVTGGGFAATAVLPTAIDCGNSYPLTASAVNGTAPYSFAWTVVDGTGWEITAGADTETATLLAGEGTATLALTVLDDAGCASMQAFTLSCSEVTSGTEEAVLSGFGLLPNPVSNQLTVRYAAAQAGDAQIRVLNPLGQVVLAHSGQANLGPNEHRLDVSALAAGTYFLSLQVSSGMVTERFVKE